MQIELDFSPLTPGELAKAFEIPEPPNVQLIIPVPLDAPEMDFRLSDGKSPIDVWEYQNSNGELLGYVGRFESGDGSKFFLPITYCEIDGRRIWQSHGFPRPYPLYNAFELAQRPNDPVLIVHGEKTADAARLLLPNFVTVTSPYGYNLSHNADWSALKGRMVFIMPDYSAQMHDMSDKYTRMAYDAGAEAVHIFNPKDVAANIWKIGKKVRRPDIPDGWDLADARDEGWTPIEMGSALGDWTVIPGQTRPINLALPGQTQFFLDENGILARKWVEKWPVDEWICSNLTIEAEVRDLDGENWGKTFSFISADGHRRKITLSSALLADEGAALRAQLLSAGLNISTAKATREKLTEYISRCQSTNRVLQTTRLGWHDGSFVMPDRSYGQDNLTGSPEFLGLTRTNVGKASGSIDIWRKQIASPAELNSRLAFAISCALAAPLIHLVNGESGGFHIVGSSSIGKTTALHVAGSVWGGGGTQGYPQTWRATSNGLEGIAAAHCDVLLCLDELGQVKGNEAGQCAYMLANGIGKIRANRFGAARPAATWRVMMLSSGEVPLEVKIQEDRGTGQAAPGQLVRFIDVEADAGKGFGMFDTLAGVTSANLLAQSLRKAATENYGHAGPAFAEHLTKDLGEARIRAEAKMAEFIKMLDLPNNTDGQVLRVARRFALVAAGGQMAAEAGILPWSATAVAEASKVIFQSWLSSRGGVSALEDQQALVRVRSYIQQYGVNFQEDSENERPSQAKVAVGFIETISDKKHYCFFPEAWRKSVCKGFDANRVAAAVDRHRFLHRNTKEYSSVVRSSLDNRTRRAYAVSEDILFEGGNTSPEERRRTLFGEFHNPDTALASKLKKLG